MLADSVFEEDDRFYGKIKKEHGPQKTTFPFPPEKRGSPSSVAV